MYNFETSKYRNLAVGLPFMLGLSSCHAWTVIQPYAMDYFKADAVSASIPFYLFTIFFAIGSIISGKLQARMPLRSLFLIGCGGVVGGFIITSLLPPGGIVGLYLFFGIIVAMGTGFSYNAVLANMQQWFHDSIGKVTGYILCMVGLSGLALNALFNLFLPKAGFSKSFLFIAIYYCIIYAPCIIFMNPAPKTEDSNGVTVPEAVISLKPSQVLLTPHYYLIMFAFMFALPAYTLISPIFVLVAEDRGVSSSMITIGTMLIPVAQTLGRLIIPSLSDSIKNNGALLINYALCIVAVLLAATAGGLLFWFCFIFIGFAYGGFMSAFPALSSQNFGLKYAGVNYGLVMIGNSLAGVISPLIASFASSTEAKFITSSICCLIGAACIITVNFLSHAGKLPSSYLKK